MQFTKAQRHKARLRLGITGPSGSGKTYGALLIAKGLGGKIAVIDTERGSASLYSHLGDFDVLELEPPYTPERFIEAIRAAEAGGYSTLIMDSITPEWNGVGGCLELVDKIANAKFRGNSWSAWNEVTPRHRAFIDALLGSPLHVIATMRSKTETAQTEENGRKRVVKLGMKSEQRDGIEYEMTTVLDLTHERHHALASKDRTGLFSGDPAPLSEDTGRMLLAWLESGVEAAPDPEAERAERAQELNREIIELQAPAEAMAWKVQNEAEVAAWPKPWQAKLWGRFDLHVEELRALADKLAEFDAETGEIADEAA